MLSYKIFRTIQVQASIFTAGFDFQSGAALALLLANWPDYFSNIAFASDLTSAPREMPRLVLQSADSHYRLQAGPARLDIVWVSLESLELVEIPAFFKLCCDVFDQYLAKFHGIVLRVAGTSLRTATDPRPGLSLSRHFLKDAWIHDPVTQADRADVEFNLATQHALGNFQVSNCLKCKSGVIVRAGAPTVNEPQSTLIIVEQEINTKEAASVHGFSVDQVHAFFDLLPESFADRLAIFFPGE